MKGIPVENLIADTQYAAAWGKHSRDAEVADLQGKWTDAQMEVYKLQEQIEGLIDARMSENELLSEVIKERDAAQKRERALVEAGERVISLCGECQNPDWDCFHDSLGAAIVASKVEEGSAGKMDEGGVQGI